MLVSVYVKTFLMLFSAVSSLIKGYPNTYTFAKAIAEEVVQRGAGNMPVSIVRPAVGKTRYVCSLRLYVVMAQPI